MSLCVPYACMCILGYSELLIWRSESGRGQDDSHVKGSLAVAIWVEAARRPKLSKDHSNCHFNYSHEYVVLFRDVWHNMNSVIIKVWAMCWENTGTRTRWRKQGSPGRILRGRKAELGFCLPENWSPAGSSVWLWRLGVLWDEAGPTFHCFFLYHTWSVYDKRGWSFKHGMY